MNDLIRRRDVIATLKALECLGYIECKTVGAIKEIEAIPSADRPRGEWKHLKGDEWLCSNCGYVVWTEGSWEHPLERGKDYCEHCGVRMKGASDD